VEDPKDVEKEHTLEKEGRGQVESSRKIVFTRRSFWQNPAHHAQELQDYGELFETRFFAQCRTGIFDIEGVCGDTG
jgi:hypothetical protein